MSEKSNDLNQDNKDRKFDDEGNNQSSELSRIERKFGTAPLKQLQDMVDQSPDSRKSSRSDDESSDNSRPEQEVTDDVSSKSPIKSDDSSENVEKIPFGSSRKPDDDPTQHSQPSDENDLSYVSFNNRQLRPKKNMDTAILPDNSPSWRKVIDGQTQGTTSTLGDRREVLFVIRGMIERVVVTDNATVTLGRFDTGTVPNEEIDLIPYGGIDRGVSRRHCKIQLTGDNLYVTDLQSTNGTFLAGVRLEPNKPTLLRKGDELLLGRLSVQVLFR